MKLQLARENATLAAAQADSKQRQAELEAETKGIADAEALVKKLQGENSEMVAQLTALRDKLRKSLEANKQKVERMLRRQSADPARILQPLIRTSRTASPGEIPREGGGPPE